MYDEVLQSVRQWLFDISNKYFDSVKIEIVSDNADSFIADLDTNRYVGQLTVSKSEFKPYRFVEFYVLDINKPKTSPPAFVYHDKQNDSISDAIGNLNVGIYFVLEG